MTGQYITIVQPDQLEGGPTLAAGTRVFAGDTEITGVIRIELVAQVNDVWRAVIHVHPKVIRMEALADKVRVVYGPPIWWRIKNWWYGRKEI